MRAVSQRQQALLCLGLLIVVTALLFAVLILPAVTGRIEFHNRLEELQFQYSRFNHIARQNESLKLELEQLTNVQADQSGFLEEKSEALAAADLQKYIKVLIDGNNGSLISTQVVQNRAETVFPQITIKVHMRSNIETLQRLLYQIASDETVLTVNNLMIQKRHQGGRRARRNTDLLEVRFNITGFVYQAGVTT